MELFEEATGGRGKGLVCLHGGYYGLLYATLTVYECTVFGADGVLVISCWRWCVGNGVSAMACRYFCGKLLHQ